MISVWFRELCKRHGNGLGRYRFPLMGCWNLRCHSFHPLPSHTERRMIRCGKQGQSLCPAINFHSICIRPVAPNSAGYYFHQYKRSCIRIAELARDSVIAIDSADKDEYCHTVFVADTHICGSSTGLRYTGEGLNPGPCVKTESHTWLLGFLLHRFCKFHKWN